MEKKPIDKRPVDERIRQKLFTRPISHDCYRRLSQIEKDYIFENAGLTDLEEKIFEMRCNGLTYDEVARELSFHSTYCKKIAVRVRKQILALIS